ncbi:chemotaxis protein CheW [Halobacteriovorax sp. HLS]|uniref:chemotaxis protein CheW n=1 Tax=Halobacteriovorax sp. HLS TaxID=2234000 RepID=UPI000FD9824A|nr:chemotaxis protein CheW [Halobacteriovorax sp. HLS]
MKYKIVCVDDELEILDIYSTCLDSSEFEVVTFSEVDEAKEYVKLNANSIIFIFSDFRMPDHDGFSFRRDILSYASEIPFALITGFYDKEMAMEGMNLNICTFLKKPIDFDEIHKLISTLGQKRLSVLNEDYEMVTSFIEESYPMLDEIENLILNLESDPHDINSLNTYFRLLHTIKGTSSCVGLQSIPAYTHRYEDLVTALKNGNIKVSQKVINTLLVGLDELKYMFNSIKSGGEFEFDVSEKLKVFDEDFSSEETILVSKDDSSSSSSSSAGTKEISKTEEEKINVSVGVLDEFMEFSGELTVLRSSVLKSAMKLEAKYTGDRDIEVLSETLDEMHKVSSLLQFQITELRKVDMESIYKPLKRVIRDACKSLNKDIELVTEGGALRIDTSLSKVLNGALIHLIRNGVDHGIEIPEVRVKAGKEAQGLITIKSFEEGENVIVEIEDNGNGMDVSRIKAKALENNLFTQQQLDRMSDQRIFSLIFESGFSTAAEVTDISGRGVGMDMVKSSVTNVGGKIHINSKLGEGSKFTLVLPIPRSVLIIKSLMVSVGDHNFCLALEDVDEVVNYCGEKDGEIIHKVEGGSILRHHGELIPLVGVDKILNIESNAQTSEMNIVIVKGEGFKYAIIVDEIHDIEEVVCKKLSKHLKGISCFQGATFVGDGEMAMVLDLCGFAEYANIKLDVEEEFEEEFVNFSTEQEFMQFNFSEKSNYAIPLEKVVRLEEFKVSKLEYTGKLALIRYRDNVLPIIDVEKRLGFCHSQDNFRNNEVLKVIVVSKGSSQYGFVVDDIKDIGVTEEEINFSTSDRDGIKGTVYINNVTVNVLDVDHIIENYKKPVLNEILKDAA